MGSINTNMRKDAPAAADIRTNTERLASMSTAETASMDMRTNMNIAAGSMSIVTSTNTA